MPIDLTKLTPAPWEVHDGGPNHSICAVTGENTCGPLFERWDGSEDTTDAEFACLARNAFDVMMRRGWSVQAESDGPSLRWWVSGENLFGRGGFDPNDWHPSAFDKYLTETRWPDPFTALVEADAWYVANVEAPDAGRTL